MTGFSVPQRRDRLDPADHEQDPQRAEADNGDVDAAGGLAAFLTGGVLGGGHGMGHGRRGGRGKRHGEGGGAEGGSAKARQQSHCLDPCEGAFGEDLHRNPSLSNAKQTPCQIMLSTG